MLNPTRAVVVGYNGSNTALDWAAAEAQRRRLPLTVLHVIDYSPMVPRAGSTPTADLTAQIATHGAQRIRESIGSIAVEPITELGHVAQTLIKLSREAELIVLGRHDHAQPASSGLLGSVSIAVSARALCPVIVVRGDCSRHPGPQAPVVVGIDASPGADAALRFAAQTAADTGATLIAVTAYRPSLLQTWTGIATRRVDVSEDPGYDEERTAAVKVLAGAGHVARQLHPSLDVREQVRPGSAANVILAADPRAGLVVVGSRGQGAFGGSRLGSVSRRLLNTAHCPVAVLRAIP